MSRIIIQKEKVKWICDFCGEECQFDTVDMSFGYGSNFDMESKNFCSDKCCCNWVINILKTSIK